VRGTNFRSSELERTTGRRSVAATHLTCRLRRSGGLVQGAETRADPSPSGASVTPAVQEKFRVEGGAKAGASSTQQDEHFGRTERWLECEVSGC